jgi:hypothetical protein
MINSVVFLALSLPNFFHIILCMQTIEGTIEQKQAQVSRLLEEIELLENAQKLLGKSEPVKRKGRPKGSKNKAAGVKAKAKKASKKASRKGSKRSGKKATGTVATPEATS